VTGKHDSQETLESFLLDTLQLEWVLIAATFGLLSSTQKSENSLENGGLRKMLSWYFEQHVLNLRIMNLVAPMRRADCIQGTRPIPSRIPYSL
jgi:hypothetical protein